MSEKIIQVVAPTVETKAVYNVDGKLESATVDLWALVENDTDNSTSVIGLLAESYGSVESCETPENFLGYQSPSTPISIFDDMI